MLSEKDVKALNGVSDKRYIFTQAAFIVFALFQLVIAFHDFSLAINYGNAMGLSFESVLSMWNAEPELEKQYLGYEVQSLHRLNMAIMSFGVALFFALLAVSMSVSRSRNKRILAVLEQCGAIELRKNA